ncbi:putative gustatory receptor 28a, partial [Schistocerca piceifrons]|uniref:putative gustatory receptor 28a n=1 Tax=Schistocerca piceifrons TaxID=274613 RepID=UPI001F5F32F3
CTSLNFVYLLNKVIGIAPFSFDDTNAKLVVSTAGKLHSVVVSFLLLASFYFEIISVLEGSDLEDRIADYSDIFSEMLFNIWWLCSITYSSEVVRREFGNTERLVKKLLLLPTPVDRSCSAELQLFAQQLAGRSVSYSAAGLFSLDLSMVRPAVATATTYLVVLVQFGLSDISKQSNNESNYLNETSR